jgi:hypothetical protein
MDDNRASKHKMTAMEVCALTIKSWNHFITGKRTQTLVWRVTEPFPDVLKDSGRKGDAQ